MNILQIAAIAVLALPAPVAFAQDATTPAAFAAEAGSSNMFEIESSQLALERSKQEMVRSFAQQMVTDHTAAGEKMNAAAQKDGVEVPAALSAAHQGVLDALKGENDDGFDDAYIEAQIKAHDQAVGLFSAFAKAHPSTALGAFAAATLPTLEEHQTHVHQMRGK